MKKKIYNLLIMAAILFAGCSDSFYSAQNYFTGPVDGVGLKRTTTIVSGGSEQLSAVVSPSKTANKNVTWSSSDTSVAQVSSSGLVSVVSGVMHGETKQAVITVTTEEGNFAAQCTVNVVEKPVAVTGVSLNKGISCLLTGNSETLSAVVLPSAATNQTLVWSSSNSLVASVDGNGVVTTGSSTGTARIMVTTADGGFTSSCLFTVTLTPVSVTGVTLNKTSTVIATGKSETLFATIAPVNATNQNLTWSSSNSAVAAVDNYGNVTGKSAGSATVTATTVDGSYTAGISVTVESSPVAVTGVSISPSTVTVQTGNQGQLTATITPSNATDQNLVWKSSNSLVASVDSGGMITAVAAGSAVITVTTQDGGYSAACTATVTSAVTYTVTYDKNGGDGTPPSAQSYLPGDIVTVKNNIGSPVLSKSGYTFGGWSYNSTTYAPGAAFPMGTANITMYAVWTVNAAYKVIYDDFGRDSGSLPADGNNYEAGSSVIIKSNSGNMVKAGYSFAGWSRDSGTTYTAGQSITMGTSDITLFAKWVPFITYICGTGTNQFWINNAGYTLDLGGWTSGIPGAYSIFVSGTDVYIAGTQWDGGYQNSVYYKNNVAVHLPWVGISGTGAHYSTSSIFVSGNDVYITGGKGNWSGYYQTALYWQTTTSAATIPTETQLAVNYSTSTRTSSVIVSGSDVYISGNNNAAAGYWLNGVFNSLSGTAANSIAVNGSDIFVAGICDDGGIKPCYWKNGARFILNATASAASSANAVLIQNGKVHIVGTDATGSAKYWVYDAGSNDCISDESLFGGTNAYSIAVPQSCDIYIAGTNGTKAVYWHNGSPTILAGGTVAYSIFVK